MLSKTDLASYLNRAEDAEPLVVRPMWMRNRIDKPAERLHLERGEMIKEVLKKTTNNRLPIHLGGLLFLFDEKKALDKYRWKSPDNRYIINLEDMTDGYPISQERLWSQQVPSILSFPITSGESSYPVSETISPAWTLEQRSLMLAGMG